MPMSNLSDHVDRAASRVKQFGEDPRMAVSIVTETAGLSKEQREVVLERVRNQATSPVTDGGDLYGIDDPGVPAEEGESWQDVVDRRQGDSECCPGCGAEGGLEKTFAPGQRRCPADQCAVVTFMDGSGA